MGTYRRFFHKHKQRMAIDNCAVNLTGETSLFTSWLLFFWLLGFSGSFCCPVIYDLPLDGSKVQSIREKGAEGRTVLETWNQRIPLIGVRAFKIDLLRVNPMTGSGRTQLTTWHFKMLISPERKQIETHFHFWLVPCGLRGHTMTLEGALPPLAPHWIRAWLAILMAHQ